MWKLKKKNHEDSIWTWKPVSQNKRKTSLWIPYLEEFENTKGKWYIHFKGGTVHLDFSRVETIMFYGSTKSSIPFEIIEKCASSSITLMFYRRNIKYPYIFQAYDNRITNQDTLSAQILTRESNRKRLNIAKEIFRKKFVYMSEYVYIYKDDNANLSSLKTLDDINRFEATITKRYWSKYYLSMGLSDVSRRNDDYEVNKALNACSFFLSSILLRWCNYHKLSVYHGFLHKSTII